MRRSELRERTVKRKSDVNTETKDKPTSSSSTSSGESKENNTNVQPKFGPMPTFPNQRYFARGVMIVAALAIVYFTSKTDKETMLARQKDQIQGRGMDVVCSADYTKDLNIFPGCVPQKCGRYVSDRLVTESEAEKLLDIGKRGFAHSTADGGAAILDLHSGALTKGKLFVNIYNTNSLNITDQLFSVQDFATYRVVRTKIQHAVAHHFGISADLLYLTHPTFFSRLTEKPAVTVHDEYWHPHVDKDTYESFHYTSLLYLSNHGLEFKGGRFVFLEHDNATVVVEPRKGRVSMFTSGKENRHYIEPITSGVRYALTVSFTCDKKYAIDNPSVPSR